MPLLHFLQIKRENDRIFRSGHFPGMHSETVTEISMPDIRRRTLYRVSEHTVELDTISCIITKGRGRITALNFANAMFPGGGYLLGGNAQEESLCRASLLYYTIRTQKQYYRRNRLHVLPDYTDTMIYTENVPVIRQHDGSLLDKPVLCNFITCPAVNRTLGKVLFSRSYLHAVMERRIAGIVQLAVSRQSDTIILGAFGCGAFGNRREEVFSLFENAVNRFVPDQIQVLFAVPEER